MKWHYQLPAYSPITLGGLGQGLRGMAGDQSLLRNVEQWIGTTLSSRRVLLTDSGTSALSLAMTAIGSPIALPAYGCYDLATAADGAEATVLLYDIDPSTLSPNKHSLDKALKAGARAVVGVHYYGIPSTVIASSVPVPLIEDAAQAFGGSLAGRPLGSFGSLAVLSFGRGKGLTGGGGGALVANDAHGVEVVQQVTSRLPPGSSGGKLWLHSVGQWIFSRPSLYQIPAALSFLGLGETPYHTPGPPGGMALACAGILVNSSGLIHGEIQRRHANANRLLESTRGVPGLEAIRQPKGGSSAYLRLPFIASEPVRSAAATADARRLGIMPGYPNPLNRLRGFETRILNRAEPMPGADILARQLITLPVHGHMRDQDLSALEEWMRVLA